LSEVAVLSALFFAIAVNVRGIVRRKVIIMQAGTLLFFGAVGIIMIFTGSHRVWFWAPPAGRIALALIALVSILIGRPFTAQFAREFIPREHWDTPEFRHVNYVISGIWCAMFSVMAVPLLVVRFCGLNVARWVNWLAFICIFLVAFGFTEYYLKRKGFKGFL